MNTDHEIWTDPMGRPARLIFLGHLATDWYPDQKGQRPPATYRVEAVHNARLALTETVLPVEPWNAYDAISDRLVRMGFTPPPPTEAEMATCVHGLSASLCAGPGHYPMD